MAASPPPDASNPAPPSVQRVLVIRLSALGDLVFALPAVAALRHLLPQARIEWLAEDRCAALPRSYPGVDEVLAFPRSAWKEARGWRARWGAVGELSDYFLRLRERPEYDLILDFQGNLKSALHLLFLRGARKLGFDRPLAREGAQRFVGERIPDPGRVHRSARDLALVRALGYTGPPPPSMPWPLDRQAERDVDLRLGHFLSTPAQGVEGGPLVLLHTEVTRYGRDKAWPDEHWRALAAHLSRAAGARVLLLWDAGSRARVLARVEAGEGSCGLAPPTPSLEHLMALTDRAAVLIGTDSGPVHLAAFRGTPTVCLFGPTDPRRYRPYGPRVRVVSALPEDQEPPPRDRSGPSPLMQRIGVEAVAAAALEALRGG